MRICLVSREVAPFWGAGIGTYVSLMAKAWAEAGHEVHILTEPHNGVLERGPKVRPGVRFHVVDAARGDAGVVEYPCPEMRHSMAAYCALVKLHSAEPFDYIEFPDYGGEGYFAMRARRTSGALRGAVLGVRLHTPTAFCRELNCESALDEPLAYLENIEQTAIREADVVISPSVSLLEQVRTRFDIPEDQPGAVVPYPFDEYPPAGFEPSEKTLDEPTLLYYGRLERRKGVDLLVDAAQRLLDKGIKAKFRFIGGDTNTGPVGSSMLEHLRRKVRPRFEQQITFEPALPRDELAGEIMSATCCCFPSLWENFPNVCLEAMSLGALVVGSDAGGMSEMIEDGVSGVLFAAGDVDALAGAIERALTDRSLQRSAATQAPKRIRTLCDPASVVAQTLNAIGQASPGIASETAVGTATHESSTPAVSVVIPFYNLAAYLPQTLDSLAQQSRRDFEIILVDDGSTDAASVAMVNRLDIEGHIRVIRKQNGGLSSARNAGFAAAKARWVLPLDADDVLHPRYIEKTLLAAGRDPSAAMIGTLAWYFHEDPANASGGFVPLGFDRDLLVAMNCAASCTALLDRQAVLDVGGYDQWLTSFEDWDLYCSLARGGYRSTIVPEFLFFYRYRRDSMTRVEAMPHRDDIRAQIMAKHPDLAKRPERAARILLSQVNRGDPNLAALRICRENLRYRVVDRLNNALHNTHLHGALKEITVRAMGKNGRR